MKKIGLIILLLTSVHLSAQEAQPTRSFIITGKVKARKTIALSDLGRYRSAQLTNINTSCSPRKEETAGTVKAVLLRDILDSVAFLYEKPRMLNSYYFLLVAADGYKVVYSFNEIYNTETGNHVYVVTEMDGRKTEDTGKGILVLTTTDIKGGSRNVKWLSEIVVGSAE